MAALNNQGFTQTGVIPSCELKNEVLLKTSMPPASSIIIAFFPIEMKQQGSISSFALRNYYKEMILRMKAALKNAGLPFSGISKRESYLFCNSTLPEKKMAEAGGLGFTGRNTLLINRTYGSRGLLSGMILPLEIEETNVPENQTLPGCGSCRACERSCPGGALKDNLLMRENCLQHWTSRDGIIPDNLKKVWGNRIYGCTVCQDVCPWNKNVPQGNRIEKGVINPEPELSFYLSQTEKRVKENFRGTAMGMKWFSGSAMIRNAILSTQAQKDPGLLEKVYNHCDSEVEGIRDAARWVLKRNQINPGTVDVSS